jgi:tRNA A37 threonylcarbamoyladenosine synthetase subunit TsaC/SUA5/YrdC
MGLHIYAHGAHVYTHAAAIYPHGARSLCESLTPCVLGDREEVFSTVVDMASDEPTVIREGSGSLDDLAEFIDI